MQREKLINARKRKGWTLEEAAGFLEISPATLERWERGTIATIRVYNKRKLIEVYEASAIDLGIGELEGTPQSEVVSAPETGLTLQLLKIVWRSPFASVQRQVLESLERHSAMYEEDMTRRDALRTIALLPLEVFGMSVSGPMLKHPTQELLNMCAAGISSCWYLLRRANQTDTAQIIDAYIPTLQSIAEMGAYRSDASNLLTQCYLFKATFARHREANNQSLLYAKKAVEYGQQVDNPEAEVLALRTFASVHYYAHYYASALHYAEQARHRIVTARKDQKIVHPLIESYVLSGLGTYQAQKRGQDQAALTSIGQAHEALSLARTVEPPGFWVDHGAANLYLNTGMTHHYIGNEKEGLIALDQVALRKPDDTSLNIVSEIAINQALIELHRSDQERDMEYCISHWKDGVTQAKTIRSQQRFAESVTVYAALLAAWPDESKIQDLRSLLEWEPI